MREVCVAGNQIRKDYLLDRYVIVAENRGARPHDFVQQSPPSEKGKTCFFCPGNEHLTPPETGRIGTAKKWLVRSFYNKFAAVSKDFPEARGSHEVLVETPSHTKQLGQVSERQIGLTLLLCQKRVSALCKDPKIKYVLVFKNQGPKAGTSLLHSHSQIIATEFVPSSVEEELRAYKKEKSCPFCAIARREAKSERRIFEDRHFIAFAPYASRSAFEVWVMPKRHVKCITGLTAAERSSLAKMIKRLLARLKSLFKYPQFNYYFHIAPKGEDFHFHMELLPRLTIWAGFELGSGMYINPVSPENAAGMLRKAKGF